jgi:hypothetical protein
MQELGRKHKRKFKGHKIQVSLYMMSSQRLESSELQPLLVLALDSGKW